ncbi:MAG: hypothetical protein V4564_25335 [Pseudomonadota bacterium]
MRLVEIDDQIRVNIGNLLFVRRLDHDMGLTGLWEIDMRHDCVRIAALETPGYSDAQ